MVSGRDAFGRDRPGLRRRHAAADGAVGGRGRQRRHPLQAPFRQADRGARRQRGQGVRARSRGAHPASIPTMLEIVREAMCGVVNGPVGTAHKRPSSRHRRCAARPAPRRWSRRPPARASRRKICPRASAITRGSSRYAPERPSADRDRLRHRARRPWRQCGGAGGARRDAEILPALSAAGPAGFPSPSASAPLIARPRQSGRTRD